MTAGGRRPPRLNADERIPHDLYRPTFVRSLLVVPIGSLGPIGMYWARRHHPSVEQVAAARGRSPAVHRRRNCLSAV